MAALAVAIRRTGCDVAQAHMSELERDMQPLAEEIIAARATSLAGLRAKVTTGFLFEGLGNWEGFLILAAAATVATALLWLAMPETRPAKYLD